jgi:hypothetical protein
MFAEASAAGPRNQRQPAALAFFGYFIFSLFFFPAALIAAYLVHDRTYLSPRAAAGG